MSFCSGRYASSTNNLLLTHPELAKEWHPTKNGDLTPQDIIQGSVKKVWWLCSKSDEHEWESTIANRANGTQCPVCIGRGVSKHKWLCADPPNKPLIVIKECYC